MVKLPACSILLVDGQSDRLRACEVVLRGLGHRLVPVPPGAEVLTRLYEQEYALVLFDLNVPCAEAFEIAATIHRHQCFRRIPIMFLSSAHMTDTDCLKRYELGTVDWLYLPVIPEILRGKVQMLVELYLKRREIERLGECLRTANAALALTREQIRSADTRELCKVIGTLSRGHTGRVMSEGISHAATAEPEGSESALHTADCRSDEFMMMLSHQLRNPLAAIASAVQVMTRKTLEDPQLVWTSEVLARQSARLVWLVESFLGDSRISQGNFPMRRESVDLVFVLGQVIDDTATAIREHRHDVSIVMPSVPVKVEGDPEWLRQIVDRLFAIVAEHTEDGAHIELALETHAEGEDCGQAIIRVRETGIEVTPASTPCMSDRRVQAEEVLDRGQDSLAAVRALVQMEGGTVQEHCTSVGRCGDIVVKLPLISMSQNAVDISQGPATAGERLKVLIVDDNEDAARNVGLLLELDGFEVTLAHAGKTALEVAFDQMPDVVLLDIGLPGMSGYDVARHLRKHACFRSTRLIAMTGYGRESDRRESEAAGFDHHLVKPVEFEKLRGLLRRGVETGSEARLREPT